MFEDNDLAPKAPGNTKAGITVCINKDDDDGPFEATVFLKKSGKTAEELRDEDAIVLTASGKLRLDIGKNGYVEIFAEKSNKLKDADEFEEPESIQDQEG
jgi:hypothetical protein